MNLELRSTMLREERPTPGLELRDGKDGLALHGVASTVGQPYMVRDQWGEFQETMNEGSFNKTIRDGDVRLLVNHTGVPLARTPKTMTLSADPHLRAHAPALDLANPTVQEMRSAMKRDDINQMSIGMGVVRDDWNDDFTVRTISEVKLYDVSIVTYPANPNTSASLRSLLYTDLNGPEQMRAAISTLEAMLAISTSRSASSPDIAGCLATMENCLQQFRDYLSDDEAEDANADPLNGMNQNASNLDSENRGKYDAAQLTALEKAGKTFPGGTSYPIDDAEDLDNAIHAVGRGNADHDAIRRYIIKRAGEMNLSSKIPANWNADGSIKTENSIKLGPATEVLAALRSLHERRRTAA